MRKLRLAVDRGRLTVVEGGKSWRGRYGEVLRLINMWQKSSRLEKCHEKTKSRSLNWEKINN